MVGKMVQNSQSIFIHIQCCYCYSRICLYTFDGVFLIHDYIYSHFGDVFIHIQRVIFIHIHDQNIHSAFSAHHLCTSLGPRSCSNILNAIWRIKGKPKTRKSPNTNGTLAGTFFSSSRSPTRLQTGMEHCGSRS